MRRHAEVDCHPGCSSLDCTYRPGAMTAILKLDHVALELSHANGRRPRAHGPAAPALR